MTKPYSEACDQNRAPILEVLNGVLGNSQRLLEIGSGTGQHAVYFGAHLPHLQWQCSDVIYHHEGIRAWLDDAALANVLAPLALDVDDDPWPVSDGSMDAVFSANTAHIMSWPQVQRMFDGVGKALALGGVFCLYGPFNYGGAFTSESNARFDGWLKARDTASGIRDFEALKELAVGAEMSLIQDYTMPVNNRILVWRKAVS